MFKVQSIYQAINNRLKYCFRRKIKKYEDCYDISIYLIIIDTASEAVLLNG